MSIERRVLLVVCLVAAVPSAWGASSLPGRVEPASTSDRAAAVARSSKVKICHVPRGNPENVKTIQVDQRAVAAHLAHGDCLGGCALPCAGGAVPAAAPKTGQTTCWDSGTPDTPGTPIACAGTGQDGEYQLGASVSPRFTDNDDGTVRDNLTGLIWLKNANCFDPQSWTDAISVSNTLASGACGLTDGSVAGAWRLPNVKELESLIDFGHFNPALPPGHPFSGVQRNLYWSSTTNAIGPFYAWFVSLAVGTGDLSRKDFTFYVWTVRGGQ